MNEEEVIAAGGFSSTICWYCRKPLGRKLLSYERMPPCERCMENFQIRQIQLSHIQEHVNRTSRGMVYFIQDTGTKHVKIGWAESVERRLNELQTGNPRRLEVLYTLPGGLRKERELHRRFRHLRYRGEWFCWSQELSDFIGMEADQ